MSETSSTERSSSEITKLDVCYRAPGNIVQQAYVDTWLVKWILQISKHWYWNPNGPPKVVFHSSVSAPTPGSPPVRGYSVAILLNRVVWALTLADNDAERDRLAIDPNHLWQELGRFARITYLNQQPWDCRFSNLSMKLGKRAIAERKNHPDKFMHQVEGIDAELNRPTRRQIERGERPSEVGNFPSSAGEPAASGLADDSFVAPPPTHRMSADDPSTDPTADELLKMMGVQPCGHPLDSIEGVGTSTQYCKDCERERGERPGRSPSPNP